MIGNNKKRYISVVKSSYGLSLGSLWQHISIDCADISGDHQFRKRIFFELLTHLLDEKKIKLAANGVYLTGTISEQLDILKNAWPPYPSDDQDDDLDEFGMWFLVKAPAGLVWLTPDGQEVWT
ncbi:DUF596 domain-containing protein [Enterobacteriaceae bacterium RIT714]|nr:DUF596 domain-containing protein [Enterobacteriaceae bacterium RIT714]